MIFNYSSYHRSSLIPAPPNKIKASACPEKIKFVIAMIEMPLIPVILWSNFLKLLLNLEIGKKTSQLSVLMQVHTQQNQRISTQILLSVIYALLLCSHHHIKSETTKDH